MKLRKYYEFLSKENSQIPEKMRAEVQKIICLDNEKTFWNRFSNYVYVFFFWLNLIFLYKILYY